MLQPVKTITIITQSQDQFYFIFHNNNIVNYEQTSQNNL